MSEEKPFLTIEDIYKGTQKVRASGIITNLTDDAHIPMPSEWAEANRYMPPDITENYGQFNSMDVPHLVEPMNRMHPDDPATHITIMKSVQSAGTVSIAENAMGFFTRYKLGSIAFFTSSKNVGRIRSSSALDVLIDHGNLAQLLKPISSRMSRKTADTAMYKEFSGGVKWLISSYNSIGDMKSNTFNFLVCDEWDEAGAELADQGDVAGILEGRTMATRMYKMLYISTPSRMETSRIFRGFIEGDQRRFHIPCPHCGEPQILQLKFSGMKHGLTFGMMEDLELGTKVLDPSSIRYICISCQKEWYESQKLPQMRSDGAEWIETWKGSGYKPKSSNHRSYHVGGLISPFLPWQRMIQQFVNTKFGGDLLLFKDFTINYLGEPWARVETKASWETFRDSADEYTLGTVPAGGLRLYGGVDVQGDRLEIGVWAIGEDMEKWLVDYRVFYGDPADLGNECWVNMHNFGYFQRYNIEGVPCSIAKICVDMGFDPRERRQKDWESKGHTVLNFVSGRADLFYPVRGRGEGASRDVVKVARVHGQAVLHRWDIFTPVIKEIMMNAITHPERAGTIHFPKYHLVEGNQFPLPDSMFKQFLSEQYREVKPGLMGWAKIHERNEVWDTAIYAVAGAYIDGVQSWDSIVWDIYRQELNSLANS